MMAVAVVGPTTSGKPALVRTTLPSGAGRLPVDQPPEIAKTGALLLAPVEVPIPISIATLSSRAFFGPVATVAPLPLVVRLRVVIVLLRRVVPRDRRKWLERVVVNFEDAVSLALDRGAGREGGPSMPNRANGDVDDLARRAATVRSPALAEGCPLVHAALL